ncbi:MAG: DNA-directed RNA polymerase subunit omega [Acidobacteria bacterium]|nr:DNA-directed RNA polymerase subunit omega [Acidobacteriota bacterium]
MKKYEELVDTKFKLVTIAAKRCRELRSGQLPRIFVASKNTARIALEEVKAGVVRFEDLPPIKKKPLIVAEGILVEAPEISLAAS